MTTDLIMALALGYLLGSIPFGLLLTALAGKGDVRKIGSGNIGATNVLRTGSKPLAALTLLLDCLKATAAILIARRFWPGSEAAAAAGAMIGHLYPLWLKFRGGKGVATLLGVLIPLLPLAAARLCRHLGVAAADDPNLVGGRHERGNQRPDHGLRSAFRTVSNAARFRPAGVVEAPREPPSAETRNRATHRLSKTSSIA